MDSFTKRYFGPCALCRVLVLSSILITGCFGGENIKKAGGLVLIDGKPSSKGTIEFYPVGGGRTANAVIQDDGTFTISYRKPGDGLPPGEYKVAVIVDKVIEPAAKKAEKNVEGALEEEGFSPVIQRGAVKHIVPVVYNSIETTPLRQTITDDGKTQDLRIEISTK